jgi:3-(3-hydroxy-phenyl)propionate hydroxylase
MEWSVAKTASCRASWAVGADGYRSLVREKLGIDLKRLSAPQTFHVFEIESPDDPGDEVRIVLDSRGAGVLWPMTGHGCRWSFQVDKHPGKPDLAGLNALIRARAPWFPIQGELRWSSPVSFAPHLAGSWGRGRVWLAGDAAHMAGPVGVQSMNAGLLEAADLADRILAAREGKSGAASLDEYGSRGAASWRALLNLDGTLDASGAASPWVGKESARILSCLPATGAALKHLLGQLGLKP